MNAPSRRSRFKIAGTALLIVAVGTMGALAAAQHVAHRKEARQRAADVAAGPRVRVVTITPEEGPRTLTFEGEAQPYTSTTLYAKVSGFLKEIRVDKGSAVRKGQVLAILESPETDRDTLALKADADNKRRTAARTAQLARQGIVSAQQWEDAESAARIAEEKLASQATIKGYQRVIAPFSGVVTQRFVDPGAMVQNGGNSSTSQPVLSLAESQRLRVAFYVDQRVAPLVKPGLKTVISPLQRPDITAQVQVSRIAGALDTRTRTMLVEADLDNRDGRFLVGGYVQVALQLPESRPRVIIPAEALTLRNNQPFVVLATPEGRTRLQAILTGDEILGKIPVFRGVQGGDRVVLNPGPALQDGDRIQAVEATQPSKRK